MKILSKSSYRPSLEELLPDYLPFYKQLTPLQKHLLINNCTLSSYAPYEIVHNNWERNYGFYLVIKGSLHGYTLSARGKEFCLFAIAPKASSSFFCNAVFITEEENAIDLRARHFAELLYVPLDIWQELLATSIAVNQYSLQLTKQTTAVILRSLQAFMYLSLEKKVALHLWETLCLQHPDFAEPLTIHQTHEEIAFALGASRESVSRTLQTFKQKGMLTTHHGKIILTDPKALQQLAESSQDSLNCPEK